MKVPYAFDFYTLTKEGEPSITLIRGIVKCTVNDAEKKVEKKVVREFAKHMTDIMRLDGFIDDGKKTLMDYMKQYWNIHEDIHPNLSVSISWCSIEDGGIWRFIDWTTPAISNRIMKLYAKKK